MPSAHTTALTAAPVSGATPVVALSVAQAAADYPATPDDAATIRAHRQLADAELAAAFAVAENRGFESGLARGEATVKEALAVQAARVAAIAVALHETKSAVLADAQDMLAEIVYATAAKILGDSILTREGIVGAVACTVRSFQEDDHLVVRLHPQDAQLLRQAWDAADKSQKMQVTVRDDPSIVLGGCIIDSARGSLDARLDTQLTSLRGTLLAVRRQHVDSGEPI